MFVKQDLESVILPMDIDMLEIYYLIGLQLTILELKLDKSIMEILLYALEVQEELKLKQEK